MQKNAKTPKKLSEKDSLEITNIDIFLSRLLESESTMIISVMILQYFCSFNKCELWRILRKKKAEVEVSKTYVLKLLVLIIL